MSEFNIKELGPVGLNGLALGFELFGRPEIAKRLFDWAARLQAGLSVDSDLEPALKLLKERKLNQQDWADAYAELDRESGRLRDGPG